MLYTNTMSSLLYKIQLISCFLSMSTSLLTVPVVIVDQLSKPTPAPVSRPVPTERIDHSEHRVHPYCQADGSRYLIYDVL